MLKAFTLKKNKIYFIPPILWFCFSTTLLTLPGSDLPKEDWLDKIWADKWIHMGMFSIMVFLWCRTLVKINVSSTKLKMSFLWIAILALAYGISMEFVQQYFIPGRSFEVMDMAADGVGSAIGFFYSSWRFIKNKPL